MLLLTPYAERVRIVLGVLALLTVLSPVPAVHAADPLVEVLPSMTSFSPNGDGSRDTLPVRFRLDERAQVTVAVRRFGFGPGDPEGTVDRFRLGTRGPGAHVWRWNGRKVPTGAYELVLRARADGDRSGRALKYAEVDRGELVQAVRVRMTRATVYPHTPGKQDRIHVHSTKMGNATDVTISDATGAVVLRDDFQQWWSWDGSGLPPGEYDATFSIHDRFGNRREIARTLRISDEHLVQRSWSTTLAAADVPRFDQDECALAPSARFPGGLTVTADCSLIPRFDLPIDIDPDVTWRFEVTGGPTVPGAPGTAEVVVAGPTNISSVTTEPGDTTTTTPWGGPHAYEWDREPEPTGWVRVDEPGASYDVATVRLEARYWTLP